MRSSTSNLLVYLAFLLLSGCPDTTSDLDVGVDGALGDSSLVDGSVADGSLVDGSVVDGSLVDGSLVDGSVVDGSLVDGSVEDGSLVDGSGADGSIVDGSVADGSDATPATSIVPAEILLHGGGTHNAIAFSPNGSFLAAFADVGGTRVKQASSASWQYKPVASTNSHRQVAGGVVLDDGTIFQLIGNGRAAGELQEISPTGVVTSLASGLAVFANDRSDGDSGARPRPVGWVVAYDSQNDLIYSCTEDGVHRYNRRLGVNDGQIALSNVSSRGFAHTNDGHLPDSNRLLVATRTRGLVEISNPQSEDPRSMRISDVSFERFEDAAVIDAGSYLGAAHSNGVYRYDGDGGIRVNGSQRQLGTTRSLVGMRYELALEANLDWNSNTGTLISKWAVAGGASAQQHRLDLLAGGLLRYRFRHSGGTLSSVTATSPVTLTGRAFVRARREGSRVSFAESRDGITWTAIGNAVTTSASPPDTNTTQRWSVGATSDSTNTLPSGSRVYRAWVRSLNTPEPLVSLDLSGVIANASTSVGVAGDTWQLSGTLTAGGDNLTPSQTDGVGANGARIRWLSVATIEVSGSIVAALGVVNPDSGAEWVYRSADVEAASPVWTNATPSVASLALGSSYFAPANRVLGASAGSGRDLTGIFNLSFDPSDRSGNTLVATGTLSLYRSTNFMVNAADQIAWESYNDSLSMLSVIDVCIDDVGGVTWTVADHNAYSIAGDRLLSAEPFEASYSGISDAWGIASIGTGANKVTILAASSDRSATDPMGDVAYHRGGGPAQSWTTSGYRADTNGLGALSTGQVPRPGGAFIWDNGNGTYGAVVYGDGVGWIRSTYNLADDSWSTWRRQNRGPVANLTTGNTNGVRPIVGDSDGVPILGLHLSTGEVYVSTDGAGAEWDRITTITATETRRKGRIAYYPDGDYAIVSDAGALTRIEGVSSGSPTSTVIDTARNDYGPVAFDSSGRAYVHMHDTGELLRFDSFMTAGSLGDANDIAVGTYYSNRVSGLAMQMTIGTVAGVERGITTYQGAGTLTWTLPQ